MFLCFENKVIIGNISIRFSEAFTLELQEVLDDIVLWYYTHSEVCIGFKPSTRTIMLPELVFQYSSLLETSHHLHGMHYIYILHYIDCTLVLNLHVESQKRFLETLGRTFLG